MLFLLLLLSYLTRDSATTQVDIQKLRLYCDPHQSERETACEIYSVVGVTVQPQNSLCFCFLAHFPRSEC